MENEDVFHVKKRGIMMRCRVSEELRKLVINTMVNYVADGGDVDSKSKPVPSIVSWDGGGGVGGGTSQTSRDGCFGWFNCFNSRQS